MKIKTPACSQGGNTNKTDIQDWWGCGTPWTLTCLWESGLLRLLWKTVKLTLYSPHGSGTPSTYTKAIQTCHPHQDTAALLFTGLHCTHPNTQHCEVDTLKHSDIQISTGREWPTTATAVTWWILLCWSKRRQKYEWIWETGRANFLMLEIKY